MSDRKQPLDLFMRCGCGGVFLLELDPLLWSHFNEAVALGKAWCEMHRTCPKRPPACLSAESPEQPEAK